MTPLRLDFDSASPWANDAGYFVGQARGYYREEGIDLEIAGSESAPPGAAAPESAGDRDVICISPYRLMLAVEQGEDLESVAAVNHTTFESLIYDRRTPVDKLIDLEGRRVAVPQSARLQQLLLTVMGEHAAEPARVELIEYSLADPDPLEIASGAFHAAWGYPWARNGVLARAESENIAWYTAPELGAPYTHYRVLALSGARAEKEPELIRAFLRATYRGFMAAAADPAGAAAVLAGAVLGGAVAEVATEALELSVRACIPAWALEAWGRHDMELLLPYARWAASEGLLSWAQGHGAEFSDSYLPPVQEAGRGSGSTRPR
ncbi:MAG: ABC transporter substrate-binding protein [Spirochaetes bacterium]|jgi:NitT/TauT family transport system substrate-binding protein|nr:ABC transporter substrate-binding protein [Spirochaetota bacterium]